MAVDKEHVLAWVRELARVYKEQRDYLTELDSPIGDADHGVNMDRGFTAAIAELEAKEPQTIAEQFKLVAMTLIRTVGGASGPLYGTWFLKASTAVANGTELTPNDLLKAFEAATEGLQQRGKANLGDKTMLDVWVPVTQVMREYVNAHQDVAACLKAAANVAKESMEATTPMKAKRGRASFLGDRSIGHQDPGATSSCLMVEAAARTLA